MILRKNIQLSQNFISRNQTDLQVILAKNQLSRKMFLYILKNMLMLLFSILVVCWIGIDGSQHNLGYQQFPDIINKLSFHNLNFDKHFSKYCRKKHRLLETFLNQFFFQLIQRKYIVLDWKIDHLSSFLTKTKR